MFFSNLLMSGSTFSPLSLFASGEQGVWYDPSDMSTLFQDSAGTTPVTAVEQPVGLVLDKSKGLTLGSELVTNGGFDSDTAWSKGTGWTIAGGVATRTGTGTSTNLSQNIGLSGGQTYEVTFTVEVTTGSVVLYMGSGAARGAFSSTGTYTRTVSHAGDGVLYFAASTRFAGTIDNVSAKLLPGNHASQSSSASRPVLRARYNLLTYSEQFDNGAWAKVATTISANGTTAPDGTLTADRVVPTTATAQHYVQIAVNSVAAEYTMSVYAKADGYNWIWFNAIGGGSPSNDICWFDVANGVVGTAQAGATTSIESVGDGWYRCVCRWAAFTAGSPALLIAVASADNQSGGFTGDGTSGIYIWGADFRATNDGAGLPAYQRIAAATDYDTVGFPPYLQFDGSDDSLATAAIDFSATDEMSVFAGVRKLSDAATGVLAELSATVGSNAGTFVMTAPENTGASGNYAFYPRGSLAPGSAAVSATTLAPVSSVLTYFADISEDIARISVNGVGTVTATNDLGTGNFASNQPLYIGSRAGSSLRFNGRLYSLIVRGKTSTADEITAAETWVAGKTGVSL
jgi:hypothetical protein